MRHRIVAIALTAVVALLPALAMPALAADVDPAPPPKVVIVVGATEETTPSYRRDADTIAAEALKYTPNVVKVYSPNATWAQVKAAAQGASIFVYLGHGYGYPSPYRPVLSPDVQDGMGLNEIGGVDDWDKKYYGEDRIAKEIRFAKDAIVLLNHLCYAAGSSESGDPEPTISVARQRVDNYASGFIRAGARTVIAQSWTSGVIYAIRAIFTTDQTLLDAWEAAPNRQGHVQPFVPVRNPQFEGRLDPETWTTGFRRSIVSAIGHTTKQVRDGAATAPALAAGTAASGSPELWSVDGPTDLTPNNDGVADGLSLLARFSEPVSWTLQVRNAEGDAVRTQTGTGHQAAMTWDATVDGWPAPDGDYTWNLGATDGTGVTGEWSGPLTVSHPDVPPTGVLAFAPTTPTLTKVGSISYSLVFASPVTGLARTDFTRTGTATGCVVGSAVLAGNLSGAEYAIPITGCNSGTVGFYLNAGQVLDAALATGPAGPIVAATVTVDNAAPKVSSVKPILKTGVAGPLKATLPLPVTLTWSSSDLGAGVASYDVQRSYDGGAWTTIAAGATARAIDLSLTPGHAYRFRVRARDNAGNIGSWVTTYPWRPALVQQTASAVVGSGWTYTSNAGHSGGSAKFSTAAGASLTYTFSGRSVAWMTTLRPVSGQVKVYVDGSLAAIVDTYADATTYRRVAWSRSWTSYGTHTIKLVVVGTVDRPRGELDAFEVIR